MRLSHLRTFRQLTLWTPRIASARSSSIGTLSPGDILNLAGKEIEIDYAIPREDFLSGRCFDAGGASFTGSASTSVKPPTISAASAFTPFKPVLPKAPLRAKASTPNTTHATDMPLQSLNSVSNVLRPSAPRLADTSTEENITQQEKTRYWTVQWRKPQTRKNKSWDGDAFVSQKASLVTLISEDGTM